MKRYILFLLISISTAVDAQIVFTDSIITEKYKIFQQFDQSFHKITNYDTNTNWYWYVFRYHPPLSSRRYKILTFDDDLNIVYASNELDSSNAPQYKLNNKFYGLGGSIYIYNNLIALSMFEFKCYDINYDTLFTKLVYPLQEDDTLVLSAFNFGFKKLKNNNFLFAIQTIDSNDMSNNMIFIIVDTLGNRLKSKQFISKNYFLAEYSVCETSNHIVIGKNGSIQPSDTIIMEELNSSAIYFLNKETLEVEDRIFDFDRRYCDISCINDTMLILNNGIFDTCYKLTIINTNTKEIVQERIYSIGGKVDDYGFWMPHIKGPSSFSDDLVSYKNIDSIYTVYGVAPLDAFMGNWIEICNFSLLTGDTNFVYRIDDILFPNISDKTATNDGGIIITCSSLGGYGYLIKFHPNGLVKIVGIDNEKPMVIAYPNPAKDNINFSCSELIKEIEVFNLLGQQVYSAKVKDKFTSINTTNFISGNYIAKLHTGKGIVVKKFVIE